jgi:2-methylcitrate dehydratase PrpD
MRPSEQIAEFVARIRYEDLPESAIRGAKNIILDTLAVAWAGAASPGCDQVHALFAEDMGRPDSSIWGLGGGRLPTQAATLVNGVSAAALDYDSLHIPGTVHAAIVVLPAVLALAEQRHVTGKALLTAFLTGHELVCRLGLSTPGHTGWFSTSMHGTFGAAVAAARLLGLPAAGVEAAIGTALGQAAGTQQANIERCFLKRMQSAFAARAGLFSALLAERGITAPLHAIDGPFGLYALYEKGDPAIVLDGLGERFHTEQTSFKKFPSCGCNHAAIQAALDLRARLAPGDAIETIEVHISPYMNRLVGAAFEPGPTPEVSAQFSVQYSVACALRRGHLDMSDLRPEAVCDPEIGRFARSIRIIVDEKNVGKLAPAAVVLQLTSGRLLREICEHVPGSPENPMSSVELMEKAKACFALGPNRPSPGHTEALIEQIEMLEAVPDVSDLFAGLAPGTPE